MLLLEHLLVQQTLVAFKMSAVWQLTLPEFELHIGPQFSFSNEEVVSKWEICFFGFGLALGF